MVVWLTALSLAVVGCGGGDDEAPDREAATYELPQLEWSDLEECGKKPGPETGGFRCGELELPFEREDASYGNITIGFAVRLAINGNGELGDSPIFAIEGGPGFATTNTAAIYRKLFSTDKNLLREHDLVLVDMRGTGRSEAVDCPDLQNVYGPDFVSLAQCAADLGKQFESYRTSAAADDINDVRQALGYDKIALYGDSYGTFLGQSYAFRHGETLNALVLDSAYLAYGEDPWYPSLVRTGTRAMRRACAREPTCPGGARGAEERMEKMAERLRGELRNVGLLVDVIVNGYSGPPDSFLEVDRAIRRYLKGNKKAYNRLNEPVWIGSKNADAYTRFGELGVGCNDYPMIWDKDASEPERRAQLEEAIREYDPKAFPPFTPREVAYAPEFGYLECLTWPQHTDLYEPPVDPETDEPTEAPVLVLSNEMDSITTPWEGKQVAELFADSEYYVAPNAGHVHALYWRYGRGADKIRNFLSRAIG